MRYSLYLMFQTIPTSLLIMLASLFNNRHNLPPEKADMMLGMPFLFVIVSISWIMMIATTIAAINGSFKRPQYYDK